MNLFFIARGRAGECERYLRDVSAVVPPGSLEVFHDLGSFADRLRRPRDPLSTLLVLGPAHDDLRRVVELRDFLKDARILLVLGDQGAETIALAHRTRPTYICYLDNGTSGIAAVLRQLMRDVHAKEAVR